MAGTLDTTTGDELILRARAIAPDLPERAVAAEQQGYVHQKSIAALREAGLFRAYEPKKYGGFEVELRTFWRIAKPYTL